MSNKDVKNSLYTEDDGDIQSITRVTVEGIDESENKRIYIVKQDTILKNAITEHLIQAGFNPYPIQDLDELETAVKKKPPLAIIVDSQHLNSTDIEKLVRLKKEQASPLQLFGLVPDSGLIPRLNAIRAGCTALFQKPIDLQHFTNVLNHKCSSATGDPYRILIIDDSEALAQYYSIILNQAGMITRAMTNPLKLLEEMESFQPNLLLMNIYMPECTGFELAAILRQESNHAKTPIIFLSSKEDVDKHIFAISLGGDDYLTKPISPQHLISAVKSHSKRASILNYYMSTDSLTGLLNHASILKQLDIQLSRAKEAGTSLSFIMIDIDHFKKINDNYGHPAGDDVLKKLAALFLSRLRRQDSVGRYGGEEFALILPNATIEASQKISDDLRRKFSQYTFTANESTFSVTFSVGITCFGMQQTASQMIDQADQALYKAKKRGRNRVVVFE